MSILLMIGAIILLVTAELTSPNFGLTNLIINKKKLKNLALVMGILFFFTIAMRIVDIITM